MTILRDLQVWFNPHMGDAMAYVQRFDKLMRRHQEITGQGDLFYLTLFGAFCVEGMNIADHEWQTLKRECLQGGSIYDTLLQVARRVPPGLRDLNARNVTSWDIDPHADISDVKLDATVKTYKIQFSKEYGEIIHAFKTNRKEYPDDATLHALA